LKASVALLVTAFLLVLMIPADAARGNSFSADLTLLGLGTDLHGTYVSNEGWMLLAGKGGVLAFAEKGEVWTYKLLSYGGSDLTAVVFSGSSGLVVGKGRAFLVEGIKGSFAVREVPFLRGDFVAAVWSLDSSFAVLLSSDGRIFGYRPGESAAYEVRAPLVKVLVGSTEKLRDLPYVPVVVEERRERNVVRKVLFVGKDLSVSEAPEAPDLLKIAQMLNRTLQRRPDLTGTVLITPSGDLPILTSYQGNLIEIDDGSVLRRITLAFNVLGMYGIGKTVVAVGEGGGIATIELPEGRVSYVSVPSSERIYFLDQNTALITSPRGLFIYSLADGSVEYIPTPSRPTSFLPEAMLVADEGGRLQRLVRPAPWRGGLVLEAMIEDGYVADMAKQGNDVVLLVRSRGKGSPETTRVMVFNEKGLRTLVNATRMVSASQLSYASSHGNFMLATGDSAYLISGDSAVRLWQGIALGPPSWHPSGCMALVPGVRATLLALFGDSFVKAPVEGSRDLNAIAWSHDGRYALIGGTGVLYAFDGVSLRELEVPYVITYHHIAARPGRDEFLASTSLGLIRVSIKAEFGAPVEPTSHDSRIVTAGDNPQVAMRLYVVSHEKLEVRSLTASSGFLFQSAWSGPTEMVPSCPYLFTVMLRQPKGGSVPADGRAAVNVQLETTKGPIDLGSYMVVVPVVKSESSPADYLSLVLLAVGVVAAGIIVVRKVRKRARKEILKESPKPEPVEEGEREEAEEESREEEEVAAPVSSRGEEDYYRDWGDGKW
jgi:photosystem II stability/assembly factor-like uncharacterized protein